MSVDFKNNEFNLRAFRALDNPEASQKYADGHMKLLESVGVTEVTSANLDWMTNQDVYVILVENSSNGQVMGGARVHIANNTMKLPFEDAVEKIDDTVSEYLVNNFGNQKIGELCGLWNSREVAGLGLGSFFLTRASVAILPQLSIQTLFGLAASYTLEMSLKLGYEIIESLGDNGMFYYPKSDFVAYALKIEDIINLPHANSDFRKMILYLRENLVVKFDEMSPLKKNIRINYDLEI